MGVWTLAQLVWGEKFGWGDGWKSTHLSSFQTKCWQILLAHSLLRGVSFFFQEVFRFHILSFEGGVVVVYMMSPDSFVHCL